MKCKLYNEFDKFAYKKRETLSEFYLRFYLLLNEMNIYNMKLEQFPVNIKFLNTLPPEWCKFVTNVKLVRDLHKTIIDQLQAYLGQHESHANKSSQYGSPYQPQQYSRTQSSTPLSITYPPNDFQSSVYHNVYTLSSSIPQVEYPPSVNQQPNFSQPDSDLIIPVFQKGDDSIDAINHMMSFLIAVTIITHNAAYQADNLDACDSDCNEINTAKVALMVNLYHYGSDDLAEKAQQLEPKLYDGNVIQKTNAIVICDSEETLMLAEEIRSKMLLQQNDPMMSEKKVNTKPVDYAVEQHRVKSKPFQVKMNKVLNENERLLEQVISKDVVNIVVTSTVNNAYEPMHECERCVKLETELQKDFIKREMYDKLFKRYTTLEKHCISLEVDPQLNQEIFQSDNSFSKQSVPSFDQLFESNELNASSQEKDIVIKKLKDKIKSLSGNIKEDKIKQELEEIETINIELDHRVKKLIAFVENSDLNASLQEKVLVITVLKDNLRKLKGKAVVDEAIILHPIDPELLKVDVAPLAPKLQNNRTAHSNYLKHTQEEAMTLREIVKHERSLNPLNTSLDYACDKLMDVTLMNKTKRVRFTEPVTSSRNKNVKTVSSSNIVSNKPMLSSTGVNLSTNASGSQPSGNTKKDKIQQTPSSSKKNKIKAHPRNVRSSLSNKNCVVKTKNTASMQISKSNVNSNLQCVTCNGCLFFDNHDLCVLEFINNVNARVKSKSFKRKISNRKGVYKYWLYMETYWKPIALKSNPPKPMVTLVYSRKPKESRNNVPVSKSKINKSLSANKKEPAKSWRSTVSNVPSSSIDECRLSKLFCDNRTEFVNQTLREYYKLVGISHETSVARSPWQNSVVKRRNRTLIEAARTMLIYARALLFLWTEAVATACFTRNHSIIRLSHGKTPYKLLHDKLIDLSYFYVFGALCCPTNDSENLGKLQPKADIGPVLHEMTHATISSGLMPKPTSSTSVDHPAHEAIASIAEIVALEHARLTGSPSSTIVDQDSPSPSKSQSTPETQPPVITNNVEEENHDIEVAYMGNDPLFGISIPEDHPLENIIGQLARPVSTRLQLHEQALFCYYDAFITSVEPKTYKDALTQSCWIEAMQEELNEFERLEVWELLPRPNKVMVITLKWIYKVKLDELGDRVEAQVLEEIALFPLLGNHKGCTWNARVAIHSAFLYGTIDEEVYVSQPSGFVDPNFPKKVYKVMKALYGLHQAPRAWYATLSTFLLHSGYRRGTIDKTLFIKKDKNDIMLVQVYIMKKFDFASVKTASTLIETQNPLVNDEEDNDVDVHLYRSIIGSLMYLTASRPDIMFAICACSRFQATLKTSHLNAVKRIFRYLKGQPKMVLWYLRELPFNLEAYSDSDCARANLDKKSNRRLSISWQETYLIAMQEVDNCGYFYCRGRIYIVNESTICIVKNLVFYSKTKHIELRHHFIRDAYKKKLIQVLKVHTDDNVVDLLAKAFDVNMFNFLIVNIGMLNL
nr:hypothetical protein [Tanacetum cinerariifolium]